MQPLHSFTIVTALPYNYHSVQMHMKAACFNISAWPNFSAIARYLANAVYHLFSKPYNTVCLVEKFTFTICF